MYFVYILLCRDGSFYTGITNHLERRFACHLQGRGAAYTRSHPPLKIIYQEALVNKSSALIREAQIKKLTRSQKITLLHLPL